MRCTPKKPLPASTLSERREQLEEAKREADAVELAVRYARQAVEDAIAANRPAWAKAHAGVSDQRREELVAAVDAFVEADRRLREAYAVDAFLLGGEQRGVGWITLLAQSGDPYHLNDGRRACAVRVRRAAGGHGGSLSPGRRSAEGPGSP